MPTNIKCPACATVFDVENVLSADVEQKIKQQYEKQLQQSLGQINEEKKKLQEEQRLFEEKRRRENELFQQKLQQEKIKLESEIQQQLRKSITADYDNQLRLLQQNIQENEEKLKSARQKEFEYLKKEQELINKEQELEIVLQKKLLHERDQLMQVIRKEEAERIMLKETEYQLKLKELEKQLEDQRKLAEEMKRRAEQGSMQLQGEVQELLLEELLRDNFPYDQISEVGKGVEGADCMQTVRNHIGAECGKIIFESKRTKAFQNVWIEKLKTDMRNQQADVAIIVTQIYPKDMHCFGERDGVWICSFSEVIALTSALRHTIIRVSETKKAEENKGEKMQMLYSYLTGTEFRQQIETIVEGFLSMKNAISKERVQMEKIWKEREKQLEKVLLSTSGLYGSIKGIAGASIGEIPLLEDGEVEEEMPGLKF
ncbi:DUF2130 domain-containing protein [Chitinophagaceae bacterium LB-8]|uniref:DUF2130 domain-containing protein n=1 Tax=Paraflavisolibacter caeni TaxID=2982496 RepID=A0A9X2XUZ4_9BACT|nr:DUF2130 domain-containing protein [Paraflavisolibacter caeni]MCU7548867.1 DUF2130 domain-containing protein [Paraflavisolibacter caeni]